MWIAKYYGLDCSEHYRTIYADCINHATRMAERFAKKHWRLVTVTKKD